MMLSCDAQLCSDRSLAQDERQHMYHPQAQLVPTLPGQAAAARDYAAYSSILSRAGMYLKDEAVGKVWGRLGSERSAAVKRER